MGVQPGQTHDGQRDAADGDPANMADLLPASNSSSRKRKHDPTEVTPVPSRRDGPWVHSDPSRPSAAYDYGLQPSYGTAANGYVGGYSSDSNVYAPTHRLASDALSSVYVDSCPTPTTGQPKKKKIRQDGTEDERRLRQFRSRPPKSFNDVYLRARSQRYVIPLFELMLCAKLGRPRPDLPFSRVFSRFYVLSRTRCGTVACPEEMIEMTGSTGNIYTVCIARRPTCDCPHAAQGHQCKHVIYVSHHARPGLSRLIDERRHHSGSVTRSPCQVRICLPACPHEHRAAGNLRQRPASG